MPMSERSILGNARPLFLIGAPRSGTTILTKLLNAHSEILLTNETAVFLQLNDIIRKSDAGVKSGILFGKAYHRLWASHLRSHARQLIESFYEDISARENKTAIKFWGEKHPHLSVCLPFVSDLYPDATYVYAVRDPRDVACSIAEMNGVPVRKAIDSWRRFADTYEKFVESLPSENLEIVKYEQLVSDYASVLSGLLNALGLSMDEASRQYLKRNKNKDSHDMQRTVDFSKKSVGRWSRDISREDHDYVRSKCGQFLRKYGYSGESDRPSTQTGIVEFECNICGFRNKVERDQLDRERRSCGRCHSSVRARSIIHLLSVEIFGESLRIDAFPKSRHVTGLSLSDWPEYARRLAKKFSYVNTFLHKKPKLDIRDPQGYDPVDFLIASEVFEHVAPPVSAAFTGAYKTLKDDGVLILTTPFMNRIESTIEHFPELFEYELVERAPGDYELVNTTADGRRQVFRDLKFHGGVGQALEMRIFARNDLLNHLRAAGFTRVEVRDEDYPKHGVVWRYPWSTPIVARK